jgi:hypothetical protein
MSFKRLQNTFKSYRRLLEADTLGSFDFFTCIICLDSIDTHAFENFLEARKTKDYLYLSKITPLAVHEFTHFIDSTSTVWGINHLRKMNDAYCSNNTKGGTEYDFYKAKAFLEYARSLRLPNYYTVVQRSNIPDRPWQSRITMGKQFGLDGKISDSPILFSQFANASGEFLARSPVSTVSLLEASAMSNEMVARLALVNELDDDARVVENRLYEKEALDYIYNQNITEYSVCVHILDNQLQCTDLFVAFQICSIITRLVLNFPKSLIGKVLDTAKIHDILGIPKGHEFEDRMQLGIRNHNLGILYYLICCALPKDSAEKKSKMVPGIEKALSRLGLSLEKMSDEAAKEVDEIGQELNGSKLSVIVALSQSGVDNFHKIPFSSTSLDFSKLSLPTVYLGDGAEVRVFGNEESLLHNIGIEEIFDELYEGHEWVERFSEACTA